MTQPHSRSTFRASRPTMELDAESLALLEGRQPLESLFDAAERVERALSIMLSRPVGDATREHLKTKRGFDALTVKKAGFGYLPSEKGWLVQWAQHVGVSLEALAEMGLLKRSAYAAAKRFKAAEGRDPADEFELGRWFLDNLAEVADAYTEYPVITREGANGRTEYLSGDFMSMPVRVRAADGRVRTAGFQFRSMRSDADKGERYRSPLNTRLLDWKKTIAGLAESEEAIAASGTVVLCEGRFDECAVSAAVRDMPDSERPGGVSLGGISVRGATEGDGDEQAGVLSLIQAQRVITFLDSDGPGSAGVLAIGAALEGRGVRVYVARIQDVWTGSPETMPKDACELNATPGGPEMIRRMLGMAMERPLEVYAPDLLRKLLADVATGGQLWHRLRALDTLVPVLRALGRSAQDDGVAHVSEALDFPPDVVRIAVDAQDEGRATGRREPASGRKDTGRDNRTTGRKRS